MAAIDVVDAPDVGARSEGRGPRLERRYRCRTAATGFGMKPGLHSILIPREEFLVTLSASQSTLLVRYCAQLPNMAWMGSRILCAVRMASDSNLAFKAHRVRTAACGNSHSSRRTRALTLRIFPLSRLTAPSLLPGQLPT